MRFHHAQRSSGQIGGGHGRTAGGWERTYHYDGDFRVASVTDAQRRVATVERDSDGDITAVVGPAGRRWSYAYAYDGSNKHLDTMTDPAGGATSYDLTHSGDRDLMETADGRQTLVVYQPFDWEGTGGRRVASITRVTDPGALTGPTTSFAYHDGFTVVTDPRGNDTTYHYNDKGLVGRVVDALGHEQATGYDVNSNVVSYTDRIGGTPAVNTYTSDGRNNVSSSTLPTGAASTYAYDDTDNSYAPSRFTTPQGNAISYDYDQGGNLASVTDANAGTTTLARNPNGTISSSTDPNSNVTGFGYDAAGNRTSVDHPVPRGDETTVYDALSRVTSTSDGRGQTTTYTYDVLDRVTQTTFDGGATVTYAYDAVGNRTSQTDVTGTTTSTYDELGRITQEVLSAGRGTTTYGYDAAGNLTALTDSAGTVDYTYNPVNLLTTLTEPGGHVTAFAYDDANNRTSTAYPNGVTQTAAFDGSNRITSIGASGPGGVYTDFDYTYQAGGADTAQRQTVTDVAGRTTEWFYDTAERLIQATTYRPDRTVRDHRQYDYDAAGNRTWELINGITTTATYNAANQITARDGHSYTHDANGNLLSAGNGQQLGYNPADQTTSLRAPYSTTSISASYAGATQLDVATLGDHTLAPTILGISRRTTASDGSVDAYTRDASGGLVGQREGTARAYYLFDAQGSVIGVTDQTGALTARYSHDPFGVPTGTTTYGGAAPDNPWRYKSRYWNDDTGLYKIGHRYYQPELGRWTQPDPLHRMTNPGFPSEANPYAYVGRNPTNYNDPNGTLSDCAVGAIALTVVALGLGVGVGAGLVALGATAAATSSGVTAVTAPYALASVGQSIACG